MHERQAIKKRVKSLLEGIWLSFYCYPATTGYLFLIISDQQFIDRFSFLGYGTDGTEDADSLDMETGIEVVEEGVLRVLLPGIGVGKHSFGTGFTYSLAEICQVDLLFISEVLWHGPAYKAGQNKIGSWLRCILRSAGSHRPESQHLAAACG